MRFSFGSFVVRGLFATLVMDVCGALVRSTGLTAGLPPQLIGKWFAYLLHGRLIHDDIAASPDIPVSLALVVAIHYAIGILLAGIFTLLTSRTSRSRSMPLLALGFGIVTVALPWFVMFPAMGFGVAGTQSPEEFLLTRTSAVNHAFLGFGLMLWPAVARWSKRRTALRQSTL